MLSPSRDKICLQDAALQTSCGLSQPVSADADVFASMSDLVSEAHFVCATRCAYHPGKMAYQPVICFEAAPDASQWLQALATPVARRRLTTSFRKALRSATRVMACQSRESVSSDGLRQADGALVSPRLRRPSLAGQALSALQHCLNTVCVDAAGPGAIRSALQDVQAALLSTHVLGQPNHEGAVPTDLSLVDVAATAHEALKACSDGAFRAPSTSPEQAAMLQAARCVTALRTSAACERIAGLGGPGRGAHERAGAMAPASAGPTKPDPTPRGRASQASRRDGVRQARSAALRRVNEAAARARAAAR